MYKNLCEVRGTKEDELCSDDNGCDEREVYVYVQYGDGGTKW
jgi:hypothetical protein